MPARRPPAHSPLYDRIWRLLEKALKDQYAAGVRDLGELKNLRAALVMALLPRYGQSGTVTASELFSSVRESILAVGKRKYPGPSEPVVGRDRIRAFDESPAFRLYLTFTLVAVDGYKQPHVVRYLESTSDKVGEAWKRILEETRVAWLSQYLQELARQ